MKKLLLLLTLLVTALALPTSLQAAQKVIYLSYQGDVPERVYNGEYFSITIKTLSTIKQYNKLTYHFNGAHGAILQNRSPQRKSKGAYVLDTFYFLASSSKIVLPNITASIGKKKTTLRGRSIQGVTLNPDKKFAGILAKSFDVTSINAKKYDNKHNILTFDAKAKYCNIRAFKLKAANEQGFESKKTGIYHSSMTYYAVIPKKYETLEFTYFNLKKERYVKVKIPINVIDDSVSTQSDLKPSENKNYIIKMIAAGVVIVIALIVLLVYRKWWIAIFVIAPGIYIALQATPAENICVNANAPVYLLPIENATVFDVLATQGDFEVKHSVKGYKQITHNNKIGWVSEDDICSN